MSSSGGGGCGLCGSDNSLIAVLTQEEFEIIQPILSSLVISDCEPTANNFFDWTELNCSQVAFCPDCQTLLREMKRLQVLVKLVTSQLKDILSKVKVKYHERPVWVKAEEIAHDNV